MSDRVRSVCVVGRDAPAWLTACAIQRALGSTGVRVQVVESASLHAPTDVYSAVPSLRSLHRLLGIDESLLFRLCNAVPVVAQRFSNWGKSAPPYFIAYDDEPPPGGDLPFTQYWVKGAIEGLRVGLEDFSLGAACAKLGRVPIERAEDSGPLSASYGYHLDAATYSQLCREIALRAGVERVGHGLSDVEHDCDGIRSVTTSDGVRVEADLFIDASGADRLLISSLAGSSFETWRRWFPCDRLIAASGPRLNSLPSFSQISAFRSGWVGLFPLQDRTAVVAAYDSRRTSDDEVAQQLSVVARIPVGGDAVVSELNQGAEGRPWIGNCIAVGEAAIATEPLDGMSLHVTHGTISHLMTTFPAARGDFPEATMFNRAIGQFAANIRDFQLAHYKLNRRFDDAMWDEARETPAPETLQRRLDVFSARSIVTLYDHESFGEQNWASLFVGSGLIPTGYDPQVELVPDEAHIAMVQERLRTVSEVAQGMPPVDALLGEEQPISAQVAQ